MMTGTRVRRGAFFDVDETLITMRSPLRFLAHHFQASGRSADEYDRAEYDMRALVAAGTPRAETNRAYCRLLTGSRAAQAASHGKSWFEAERKASSFFHPAVIAAYRAHAEAGYLMVLVSASFAVCVDPIAQFLGTNVVLCSRPEVQGGRFTGELLVAMVGQEKAAAVRAEAASRRISLQDSYAYGDDASDLPLLTLVGNPVVVGDDPLLTGHAALHGWRRLPRVAMAPAAGTW